MTAPLIRSRFGGRPRPKPRNRSWQPTGLLPPLPPETVPVERAATQIRWSMRHYLARMTERQRQIDAARAHARDTGQPVSAIRRIADIDEIPPMATVVTTGVGKSAAVRRLIDAARDARMPIALVCPTHEAIDDYRADVHDLFHYRGRSAPADELQPGQKQPASTCWKLGLVSAIARESHRPQPTICRSHCEHGQKRALDRLQPPRGPFEDPLAEKRAEKLNWFRAHGFRKDQIADIKPCLWLDHQEKALGAQMLAMPASSFSETMAKWGAGVPDPVDRLVVIDEAVPLGEDLAIGLEEIAAWQTAASAGIANRREAARSPDIPQPDRDRIEREIEGLGLAEEMCATLAEYLGTATAAGGTQPIPGWLRDRMKEIKRQTTGAWSGGAAPWEKVEWDRLEPVAIPRRAASAIIETLAHDGGYVADGKLHVVGLSQVGEWLAAGRPAIVLDATLPAETRAVIEAGGGTIEEVHVRQNLHVIRYPNALYGRGRPQASTSQADHTARCIHRAIEAVLALPTDRPRALLTHLPWQAALEAEDERNPDGSRLSQLAEAGVEVGHFGLDDRAHDRWNGRHLAIVGGPILRPAGWRSEYGIARLTALAAGADPAGWPAWPTGPDSSERGLWIDEGHGVEVLCHAPLPADPAIRAWVLCRYRQTIVQAIGRARAVRNQGDPITVAIHGGLPVDLAAFGIDSVEYRDNALIGTVEGRNAVTAAEADRRFERALEAVLARGERPSRRLIEAEMRRRGEPVMNRRGIDRRLGAWREERWGVADLAARRAAGAAPPPGLTHAAPPSEGVAPPSYKESSIARGCQVIDGDESTQQAGGHRGVPYTAPPSGGASPPPVVFTGNHDTESESAPRQAARRADPPPPSPPARFASSLRTSLQAGAEAVAAVRAAVAAGSDRPPDADALDAAMATAAATAAALDAAMASRDDPPDDVLLATASQASSDLAGAAIAAATAAHISAAIGFGIDAALALPTPPPRPTAITSPLPARPAPAPAGAFAEPAAAAESAPAPAVPAAAPKAPHAPPAGGPGAEPPLPLAAIAPSPARAPRLPPALRLAMGPSG